MAYQDALFQLGMDLTRSSTAQEEDLGEAARAAHTTKSVSRRYDVDKQERSGRSPAADAGVHLIVGLFEAQGLNDAALIERTLTQCVEAMGNASPHVQLHSFAPAGSISAVASLPVCRVSFHSWPEGGYAALDVTASDRGNVDACIQILKAAFTPRCVELRVTEPGQTAVEQDLTAERTEAVVTPRRERQRNRIRRAA
ncbi:MAG: S-adenosylmethionine decarboxylase [Hyphomicrobiaceae bacterium]